MSTPIENAEHKKRHRDLMNALDELVADWISGGGTGVFRLPSTTSLLEFMQWAAGQCEVPDEHTD